MNRVRKEVREYIEKKILPIYEDVIGGHDINHIKTVIKRSFELVDEFKLDVNLDMVYVIAAFHDIGYKVDPDKHEEVSSQIFRETEDIKRFFNDQEINIMAEAIVDHRASLEYEARSIYGKIVSSADREVSVDNMLERSILFQRDKHKDEDPSLMEVIEYSYKKLKSKYGKGGYAKMYYPDKKYTDYLDMMQELLDDKDKFAEKEMRLAKKLGVN